MRRVVVKRVYDSASPSDGVRVLVDRLWPRGVTKKRAHIDMWAKEIAPSTELRKWYHAKKPERFKEFQKKYHKELISQKNYIIHLLGGVHKLSLITSVREVQSSHIPVLERFLKRV